MILTRVLHYQITQYETDWTVEEFLQKKGYSRNALSKLKRAEGGLTVNGRSAFSSCRMKTGDTLTVQLYEPEPSPQILPAPMDLSILYEDEDLMIIDKAAGIPVHPSQGHRYDSLANGIVWYSRKKGTPFSFRAVNRLDSGTSGLLIVAKNLISSSILSQMVKDRLIRREYLALATGRLPDRGTIIAPIGRAENSIMTRRVDFDNGDYACTHYERLFYNPDIDCSLARIHLDTGRTHQIRVHFQYIGHPLPGDFLYHPDYSLIGRTALHSWRLSFSHPITKAPMVFTASVPEDIKNACPFPDPVGSTSISVPIQKRNPNSI